MLNSTQKKEYKQKNGEKDEKALYKLMNNAVYGKIMKNVRNRINAELASKKKRLFKMDIQTKL